MRPRPPQPPLSRFFRTDGATPSRVEAEWDAIEARLARGRSPWRRLALGGALAATTAVALVMVVRGRTEAPPADISASWEGIILDGAAGGTAPIAFGDGSQVTLGRAARARITRARPRDVKIDLLAGEAAFDVAHHAGRSFVVSAAGVAVRVVGTQFRVALGGGATPGAVTVSVSRGAVEVQPAGAAGPIRVAAGQSSVMPIAAPVAPPAAEPVAPPALAPVASEDRPLASLPKAAVVTAAETEAVARIGARGPAGGSLRGPSRGPSHAPSRRIAVARLEARRPGPDAQVLFDQANAARRAGQLAEAASLYDRLLAGFPQDRRAALAAFELGRLRMDALHDVPGALEALKRAVRLAPEGSLREDAQARIVYALDASRETGKCRSARDEYLARYPSGVHALAVKARCGDRSGDR